MAYISVVIPVFKADGCLGELYRRLKNSLGKISDDFEIIMVEDGGGDGSWSIIEDLCKSDNKIKKQSFKYTV